MLAAQTLIIIIELLIIFQKCGNFKALEIARTIRRAVVEYEARHNKIQKQKQQTQNNDNNHISGQRLLQNFGVGAILDIGLPLV